MADCPHGLDDADVAQFWSHVEKGPGCWLWTGYVNEKGYGRLTAGQRRHMLAHRFAYELLIGPIPAGLTIDHVRDRGCTHRNCVNPAHLEAVTQRVNTMRGDTPSSRNARKTACPKCGSPFRTTSSGRRECPPCVRTIKRDWWRRHHGKAAA